jgi:hypothetical protein
MGKEFYNQCLFVPIPRGQTTGIEEKKRLFDAQIQTEARKW